MRISSNIASGENFYTDLNGFQVAKFYSSRENGDFEKSFQMIRRKRYSKLPLQANFYPLPSLGYVQDAESRWSFSSTFVEQISDSFLALDKNFERQAVFGVKPTVGRDQRCQWSDWGKCWDFVIFSMMTDKCDNFNSFQIISMMRDWVEHFIYVDR